MSYHPMTVAWPAHNGISVNSTEFAHCFLTSSGSPTADGRKIGNARKRKLSFSGDDAISWSRINKVLPAISCARETALPPNEVAFHTLGAFASNQKRLPAPSYMAKRRKAFWDAEACRSHSRCCPYLLFRGHSASGCCQYALPKILPRWFLL